MENGDECAERENIRIVWHTCLIAMQFKAKADFPSESQPYVPDP